MSNHDIRLAMRTYHNFLGVFPSDINPCLMIHSFPTCFVMNTNPTSDVSGGHWVAFYLPSSRTLEFFDSLGRSLDSFPQLASYFAHFTHSIRSNSIPLQSNSPVCGDYCITFLILRLSKHSFSSSIHYIKSHSKGNSRDSFVRRFRLLCIK